MKYMDPFWFTFLEDFKDDEQTRHEQEAKNRLKEAIERHKEAAQVSVIVNGSFNSH